MDDLELVTKAIIEGDEETIVKSTKTLLDQKVSPEEIIGKGMIPGMNYVGEKFEVQEMFIPEMLLAARAMHAGLNILRPLLKNEDKKTLGRVVIGTVRGDLHDIGKNLVAWSLEGAGFEVFDLGIDVPVENFIKAIREKNADIVCLSGLLTVALPHMPKVIKSLNEAGLRDKVKVLVGGAPVTQQFADEIGADGYSPTSWGAVLKTKELLGINKD
jgi:5-methyltetrahydrofolate--homocysteine methyltransferase